MTSLPLIPDLSYSTFVGMTSHAAGQVWTADGAQFASQWAWAPDGDTFRLHWGANPANWDDRSQRYYEQFRIVGEWVILDGWSLYGEEAFLSIHTTRAIVWRDANATGDDITEAFPAGQPYALEQIPTTPYALLVEAELVDATGTVAASFRDFQQWESTAVEVAFGASVPGLRQTETFRYLQLPPGSRTREYASVMTITAQQMAASVSGTWTRIDGTTQANTRQGTRYRWNW